MRFLPKNSMTWIALILATLGSTRWQTELLFAQTTESKLSRDEKVRLDKAKFESSDRWIYNELEIGFTEAKQANKPLLVAMRCIPCEECVKLDDDLIEKDPAVQILLDEFVCVRLVSTNGLDLSLFQFDTDQSFNIFIFNPDRTIYGRYGTRSARSRWQDDVSVDGLVDALKGALDLHKNYDQIKDSLTGKTGTKPQVIRPEQFPTLKNQFTASLDYEGNVVKSCIHCHQIGDAQRDQLRLQNQPIPDELLFPYPHPKSIGLILSPNEKATIKQVSQDSLADQTGLLAGDKIQAINGQPILSIADIQWVLHHVPASGGSLEISLLRGEIAATFELRLPNHWRQQSGIQWRVSTWGLRRMGLGGLMLTANLLDENATSIQQDTSATVSVKSVGQYGPHAAAKRAGFKVGDQIIKFGKLENIQSEQQILRYAVQQTKPGDLVTVTIIRDGEEATLQLPMQR